MKALQLLHAACAILAVTGLVEGKRYEELGRHHQGDMVLTGTQEDAATGGGISLVYDAYKWPKGTVPYRVEASFTQPQVEQIRQAMHEITSRSCVRFVERAGQPEFLNITASPSGCWATLGKNVLANQLNLDPAGCLRTGVIVHQLLHVLGLTHPQSRPDRDFYVLVEQDALEPSQAENLRKYRPGVINDFGMPYDYESILHCETDAFGAAAIGRASVVPLDDVEIGQREALSLKDVRKLNKMYDYDFCAICVRGHCQ